MWRSQHKQNQLWNSAREEFKSTQSIEDLGIAFTTHIKFSYQYNKVAIKVNRMQTLRAQLYSKSLVGKNYFAIRIWALVSKPYKFSADSESFRFRVSWWSIHQEINLQV